MEFFQGKGPRTIQRMLQLRLDLYLHSHWLPYQLKSKYGVTYSSTGRALELKRHNIIVVPVHNINLICRPKKRKRIRLTIIEQISPSDNDDGVIPPPPPGSPPMLSMKEFLARYPISTPALPMQMAATVN